MRPSVRKALGIVATTSLLALGAAQASPPASSPAAPRSEGAAPPPAAGPTDDLFAQAASSSFRIALQSGDNLQWLGFWVAQGAGYFGEEGLDVQVVVPPMPGAVARFMLMGRADAAILPPPVLFDSIARGEPVVTIANLLQADPINLVLAKSVADELGITSDQPLRQRLEALEGLRVGVAPGPPTRLRALFRSAGLEADSHIEMVIVDGDAQNQALANGEVDALYAHTPYLERALLEQGGVLLVNQSGGEVPELAGRQIYSLATSRANLESREAELKALVRAIHRAQLLVREDPAAAAEAVRNSSVELHQPNGLERIIEIYRPAVPASPEVSAELLAREAELLPAHRPAPDLGGVDLDLHVDNRFPLEAVREVR
jgi:NitT/TauT family transport system substrate-binding protein